MNKKPTPKKGERFQECDKRFYRIVEVVKVVGDRVYIKTLETEVGDRKLKNDRVTVARKDRFYRYSHGYRRLYGKCHACQIAAGAVVPAGGHRGITITIGTCSVCLKRGIGLIPSCDYHWPKEGRRAVFD